MSFSRRRLTVALAAAGTVAATVVALPSGAGAVEGCPPLPSSDHTIPAPAGPPAAISQGSIANGPVVGYAALGRDGKTYWYVGAVPIVSTLSCFGGQGTDSPALADYTDGFTLFVLAPTGRVYEQHVVTFDADQGEYVPYPLGQGWRAVPGGAASAAPATVSTPDGSLHVFFRGTDGRLKRLSKSSTVGAGWTAVQDLGGSFAGVPAVMVRPGGGFVVVVRTATGALYSRTRVRTGAWGTWTKLTGAASSPPSIAASADGPRDLFVIGSTGGLYRAGWVGTGFGAFRKVDGVAPAGARIAAAAAGGRIVVYVRVAGRGSASTGVTTSSTAEGAWTPYVLAPYTYPEFSAAAVPGGDLRSATLVPMPPR